MADPLYCPWIVGAPCMKPEVWAAWWQAIGSVIAILVAILIPTIGSCMRTRRELRREFAFARAHAVHVTKDIDLIRAHLNGVVRGLDDIDERLLSALASAHFVNRPNGGGPTRNRSQRDQSVIATASTKARQMREFLKVPDRLRATAPTLAMLPKVGQPLLTLIVSIDQLYESNERAIECFAEDSFNANPFIALRASTERTIKLLEQLRDELLKLFPDAVEQI